MNSLFHGDDGSPSWKQNIWKYLTIGLAVFLVLFVGFAYLTSEYFLPAVVTYLGLSATAITGVMGVIFSLVLGVIAVAMMILIPILMILIPAIIVGFGLGIGFGASDIGKVVRHRGAVS